MWLWPTMTFQFCSPPQPPLDLEMVDFFDIQALPTQAFVIAKVISNEAARYLTSGFIPPSDFPEYVKRLAALPGFVRIQNRILHKRHLRVISVKRIVNSDYVNIEFRYKNEPDCVSGLFSPEEAAKFKEQVD